MIIILNEMKNDIEIKLNKINRLINDISDLKKAKEDIKYLQKHAGEMFFTGNSGKIGEREIYLKKIKINTLAGCKDVPELLIVLADKRLEEIEKEISLLKD